MQKAQLYTFVQCISMNLFSLCTGVFQQRASNLNELQNIAFGFVPFSWNNFSVRQAKTKESRRGIKSAAASLR